MFRDPAGDYDSCPSCHMGYTCPSCAAWHPVDPGCLHSECLPDENGTFVSRCTKTDGERCEDCPGRAAVYLGTLENIQEALK